MSGISRRSLLGSMLALAAAPAIVRAQSIMRVAPPKIIVPEWRRGLTPGGWLMGGGHADYVGNGFVIFDRALSDSEWSRLSEQPRCLFVPTALSMGASTAVALN